MAEGQAQGSQGGQLEPQDQQIQQPAPQQHQPPPVPPLQSTSSGDSSYRCQWVNCNEYHPSPEQLYVWPSISRATAADVHPGACLR